MNPYNTKKNSSGQPDHDVSQGIFSFWKEPGETLAVMLRRFRETHGLSIDEKLTYAGRLDPMAEGIVPILAGQARFHKDHMMAASKTYEVAIVLGLSTDTGDMLGILTKQSLTATIDTAVIKQTVTKALNVTALPYPNYSSRPVDGKPLFMHARAGNKVVVPIKKVTIFSLELIEIKKVPLAELLQQAIEIIKTVQGDFRQAAIIEQWQNMIETSTDQHIQIVSIKTTVSSGTYMRSLAEKIGELLGVPALAYSIVRTNIETKK